MPHIEDQLLWALAQQGKKYVYGATAAPEDDDPEVFDCAELIFWSASQVHVALAGGSWLQFQQCSQQGTVIEVPRAIATRGALLFKFSSDPMAADRPRNAHVAQSLGDGTTIEARGTTYGVGVFSALKRGWTHAALVPGFDYTPGHDPLPPLEEHMPLNQADMDWIRQTIYNVIDDKLLSAKASVEGDKHVDLERVVEAVRKGDNRVVVDTAIAIEDKVDQLLAGP